MQVLPGGGERACGGRGGGHEKPGQRRRGGISGTHQTAHTRGRPAGADRQCGNSSVTYVCIDAAPVFEVLKRNRPLESGRCGGRNRAKTIQPLPSFLSPAAASLASLAASFVASIALPAASLALSAACEVASAALAASFETCL